MGLEFTITDIASAVAYYFTASDPVVPFNVVGSMPLIRKIEYAVMVQFSPNRAPVLSAVGEVYTMVNGKCAVMVTYRGSLLAILSVAELTPTITKSTCAVVDE